MLALAAFVVTHFSESHFPFVYQDLEKMLKKIPEMCLDYTVSLSRKQSNVQKPAFVRAATLRTRIRHPMQLAETIDDSF